VTQASLAQQGIWFTEQVVDAGSGYHIPLSISLAGELRVNALIQACDDLVARHPLLSTALSERDGALHVVDAERPAVRQETLAGPGQLPAALREETVRSFDLRRGPLARFTLFALGPSRFHLLFVAHHAVFDGMSKDVLVRDLAACYNARVVGGEPELPAAPPAYATHVAAEGQRVAAAVPAARRFWARRWRPRPVMLPGLAGAQTASGGESVQLRLQESLDVRIRHRAREIGVSRFEFLLATLHVLLSRYGNDEPAVAIDLSTRTPQHRDAIGVFVNELPVSVEISAGMTFRTFATRLHAHLRQLYGHWEVPLSRAVAGVQPATSLAPVSMSYRERAVSAAPSFTGLVAEVDWMAFSFAARSALHVQVVDGADGLAVSLQYSSQMMERAAVELMSRHLATLLDGVVTDPDIEVGRLPMLGAAERATLLGEWNATGADLPGAGTLHGLVEAQVARTPDATAATFDGAAISYAELDVRANRLAHRLRGLGAGPETVVAICAERSLELVVGLLGILKAGAAYLPLDPDYPPQRLAFMLSDARPAAVVTQRRLLDALPADIPHTVLLDRADGWNEPAENPAPTAGPENAAYVIYTSGSTGRPKGVVNTHGGICNRLRWMQRRYRLTADDVVLQKTPVSFDVSVWELFLPLLAGASLTLARPGGHKDPGYLRALILDRGVTTVHFVPSMLAVFLAEDGIEQCRSLRRVICSGEELPGDLARRCVARLGCELHNLYGPTEAAIDVSHWHCRPEQLDGLTRVPIGRPIDNIQLYVLDPAMDLVPTGAPGELHIGGVGVARGYLGRPELTAERFVPNPFGPPGSRLYKTGDLARYRLDGALEFLGRIDTQIKIRGQRVELGEIEAVLREQPPVRDAAVTLREDRPGDQRLVAYVVPVDGDRPNADALRAALRRVLPDYMVPASYLTLDALPTTPNGKLDRAVLPAPGPQPQSTQRESAPGESAPGESTPRASGPGESTPDESTQDTAEPRTGAETMLASLWQEVLGVDRVGIDDDFFDLGGHSLLATRVVSRLRRQLPPEAPRITVMDLFALSTVRELAALIESPDPGETGCSGESVAAWRGKRLYELTPPVPAEQRRLTVLGVPYAGTSAVVFQPLADALPPGCSLYAVALPGHDPGVVEEARPLDEVAEECAREALSRIEGPLVLYSHCLGSALTIEIARRLEAAGRELEAIYIGANFPFALPRRGALGRLGRLTRIKRLRGDRSWANWLRGMGADLEGLPADEVMAIVRLMREDGEAAEDYFSELFDSGAPTLNAPIISVVGERDPITEYYQERYREWHFLSQTTALVVLDEAGHYFLKFRPQELAAIVTSTHAAIAAGTTDSLTHAARGPDASWWLASLSRADPDRRRSGGPSASAPRPSLGRFLAVAAGQLVSITGSALTEYAVPLWIYLRTGSLTSYATAWIFGMVGLFLAPVAGAIVDRCDRRRVMLAGDCAAGLIQGAFALVYLTGHLEIWEIWVGLACLSVALVFQRLAYASAVPQLVPKHFLGHANGVVQLSVGMAQFVVPLIAAAMIALFDLGGILVFDLLSFVVAVTAVALIRFPATMPHTSRESLAAEIVNGWRYSMGNRYIRGMVGFMGLLNVFLSALILLIFPLVLSFGSLSTVATVSFIGGAGVALGGLTMTVWGGPSRRRMYGMLVAGVAMGAFGMFAGLRPNIAVVAAGLCGLFFCVALVNGLHATIVQVKVPQRYHGRVFALDQMIAWSTIPLGIVVIAPLAIGLFDPLLVPGGALAGTVGQVIGVGEGRGIGLSYLVLGLLIVGLSLAALRNRALARFDRDVPDALPDDVVGIQALQARGDRVRQDRERVSA
jgi:amino acid adenylation domain-containing protein